MVVLLKEFYGRGPTRTKTYYEDDLVVCLLRGGYSRVEQTLLEGGRGSSVIQQRMEFQELMRERFVAVIEEVTSRSVIGFMSGNQQDPDIMCEVFILDPTDLLDEYTRSPAADRQLAGDRSDAAASSAHCARRLTQRRDLVWSAEYGWTWRASIVKLAGGVRSTT
jgi:uncharacterized protein YbcI